MNLLQEVRPWDSELIVQHLRDSSKPTHAVVQGMERVLRRNLTQPLNFSDARPYRHFCAPATSRFAQCCAQPDTH